MVETGVVETTGPAVCNEADIEPNGNPVDGESQDLPDQFCGSAASVVSGTLLDDEDLDAFVYFGEWDCGSTNNPNHRVEVDGPVTACVFPLCPLGNPTDTICLSGTAATVNGVAGCCSDDVAVADVNCQNTPDESSLGFLLVESADAACTDYTLTYAFDDA